MVNTFCPFQWNFFGILQTRVRPNHPKTIQKPSLSHSIVNLSGNNENCHVLSSKFCFTSKILEALTSWSKLNTWQYSYFSPELTIEIFNQRSVSMSFFKVRVRLRSWGFIVCGMRYAPTARWHVQKAFGTY